MRPRVTAILFAFLLAAPEIFAQSPLTQAQFDRFYSVAVKSRIACAHSANSSPMVANISTLSPAFLASAKTSLAAIETFRTTMTEDSMRDAISVAASLSELANKVADSGDRIACVYLSSHFSDAVDLHRPGQSEAVNTARQRAFRACGVALGNILQNNKLTGYGDCTAEKKLVTAELAKENDRPGIKIRPIKESAAPPQ